jgi:hypothetical protein
MRIEQPWGTSGSGPHFPARRRTGNNLSDLTSYFPLLFASAKRFQKTLNYRGFVDDKD